MQVGTSHALPPTLRDSAAAQHTALGALLRGNNDSTQQNSTSRPSGSSATVDPAAPRGGALSVTA